MEIVLRQDVDPLGLEGDITTVAKGYARNYLIPKGMAVEATHQNIKALELQRKKIDLRRLKARGDAENFKKQIDVLEITFSHKASEEGKLYGSVTSMDIAAELETRGVFIDRRKIVLERPIKSLGELSVPVKIYPEVTANIKVIVVPKEEKAE